MAPALLVSALLDRLVATFGEEVLYRDILRQVLAPTISKGYPDQ